MFVQTASAFRNASWGPVCWRLLATWSPIEVTPQPCSPPVNRGSPASHMESGWRAFPQWVNEMQGLGAGGLGTCLSHTGQCQAAEESPRGQGLTSSSNQPLAEMEQVAVPRAMCLVASREATVMA